MNIVKRILNVSRHDTPVFFQAEDGSTVTPSDTTILGVGVLYIGGAGNVNVVTK